MKNPRCRLQDGEDFADYAGVICTGGISRQGGSADTSLPAPGLLWDHCTHLTTTINLEISQKTTLTGKTTIKTKIIGSVQ